MLPVLLVFAAAGLWSYQQLQPASETPGPQAIVIPNGATPREIGRLLQRKGIIRNDLAFVAIAMEREKMSALKSGRYELSPHMTLAEIVDRIARGGQDVNEVSVTIPEGYTLKQIAAALGKKGIIKEPTQFEQTATRGTSAFNLSFPISASTLEGYLYPETYRLAPGIEPERAAETMLKGFESEFYEPNRKAIESNGHSLHELVTIASLIEREARVPKDRARISGVIANRLKKGMRLEIDATVLYALGEHKNRVLYRDLKVDSPYNTYRIVGLPPGPIANPGKDSLMAALYPEKNDFFFYVAAPDGSHVFSRTMAEHSRNVARMRAIRRSARP